MNLQVERVIMRKHKKPLTTLEKLEKLLRETGLTGVDLFAQQDITDKGKPGKLHNYGSHVDALEDNSRIKRGRSVEEVINLTYKAWIKYKKKLKMRKQYFHLILNRPYPHPLLDDVNVKNKKPEEETKDSKNKPSSLSSKKRKKKHMVSTKKSVRRKSN